MAEFTPKKCKQIALARLDIVHQWLKFRKQSQNKLQADYDFVKLHNTSNSHLFKILGKISRGSLHRWYAMLNGTEDYTKLLPQYKYSSVNDYTIDYFLENYVKNNCKYNTYRRYRRMLKYYIYPFFKNKNLNDITCNDIQKFYYFCKGRNLPPKVLKNTLALLNQMIKYFQNLGIIERTCNFQVRRLSDKTNFTVDRIIFEV